jgi:hypothetical protein
VETYDWRGFAHIVIPGDVRNKEEDRMSTPAFPVFGANGEEGEMGPELRCGLPVFHPSFQAETFGAQDAAILRLMAEQNPELTGAHLKLERARSVVKYYSEMANELGGRVVQAQAAAQRANASVMHEDFLHPQRIDDPAPLPGPNNRLAAVLEEQRECREELAASVEELIAAERIHNSLLEKAGFA